jgi:hypothetical protein
MVRMLTAALALVAASGPPARAQVRIVPNAPLVSEFAACAARRWPDQARALMGTPIGSRQEYRIARRLAESRSDCVRRHINAMQMRAGALRGAVAEALLEGDPGAMARLRALPSTPPVRPPDAQGRAFVTAFARCIADAEPVRAVQMLELGMEAPPPEHQAAFRALGGLLDDCTPLGVTAALDPRDVRNHIAMRLYEIAFPPR